MITQPTTRDTVTAWVNPPAWDDAAEAERVIDAILASGSDDEADWVRIAGGDESDVARADTDDAVRAEARLAPALDAYRAAEHVMSGARVDLHTAIRAELARGTTAYRVAQITGLSERYVGRLRG